MSSPQITTMLGFSSAASDCVASCAVFVEGDASGVEPCVKCYCFNKYLTIINIPSVAYPCGRVAVGCVYLTRATLREDAASLEKPKTVTLFSTTIVREFRTARQHSNGGLLVVPFSSILDFRELGIDSVPSGTLFSAAERVDKTKCNPL